MGSLVVDHAPGHRLQRVVGRHRWRLAGEDLAGGRGAGKHGAHDVARRDQVRRGGIDDDGVHLVDAHQRRHLGQRRARRARDQAGRHDVAGLHGRKHGTAVTVFMGRFYARVTTRASAQSRRLLAGKHGRPGRDAVLA